MPADALSHPFFSAVSPARALLAAARHLWASDEAAPAASAQADGVAAAARVPMPAAEGPGFPAAPARGGAPAERAWSAAAPRSAAAEGDGMDVGVAWALGALGGSEPEAGMDAAFAHEAQSATTMASSAEARALGAGLALAPDAAQGPADHSRPQWRAGRASPGSDAGQSVAPEVLRPTPAAYAHAASTVMGAGQAGARTAAAPAAPLSPVACGPARVLPSAAGSMQAASALLISSAVHATPAPGGPADPPSRLPVPPALCDAAAGFATPAAAARGAEATGAGAPVAGQPPALGGPGPAPGRSAPAHPAVAAGTPGAGGGGLRPAAGEPGTEGPAPGSAATPGRTRRAWQAVSALMGEGVAGGDPWRERSPGDTLPAGLPSRRAAVGGRPAWDEPQPEPEAGPLPAAACHAGAAPAAAAAGPRQASRPGSGLGADAVGQRRRVCRCGLRRGAVCRGGLPAAGGSRARMRRCIAG